MHKESRVGALLFFCPAVRKEIPVGFRSEVLQVGRLVQHVGEIVEEVDAVASAGAGQGVEDTPALGAFMAAEEEGVVSGQRDVPIGPK